ncbi:hypothetical protein [Allocoleopsis franciscana]|uniref:Thioredoxin domain-containing protein n=1 Tax=Allocoleopsis franciscana PCC 7113 TaxID=1173027 RepID=K9WIB9_9CYAN|nr:hypothetical protein [Allocoleopsis franciscana]AFZ19267.1 hypothetical protein Mic7113_3543 [Allocoleopsis franciscana PCC 7113]
MQPHRVSLVLITRTLTITLLGIAAGCSQAEPPQTTVVSDKPSTPAATTLPKSSAPAKASPASTSFATPAPQADPFPQAMDTAMGAATLTQSAICQDDWNLIANQWQRAIVLLKSLPTSHPKRALAQQKIAEYQRKLAYAKQQVVVGSKPIASSISPSSTLPASQPPTSPTQRPPASVPFQPTTPSTQSSYVSPTVALARHLQKIGAKMYTTFWCSACRRQEQQFGEEALSLINIIECDPRGKNAQPRLCRESGIRAYPTWEINGQLYEGGMPLETLANLSGYQGSRNFSN